MKLNKSIKEVTFFACEVSLGGTTDNNYLTGSDVADALMRSLEEHDLGYKYIRRKIATIKEREFKGGFLVNILHDELTLDFDLAVRFQLFDIIAANCFISKSKLGKELIQLMVDSTFYFVMHSKVWESADSLHLRFYVANDTNEQDLQEFLR